MTNPTPPPSPRSIIEKLFKVESKIPVAGQRIIPFKLNPIQAALDRAVTEGHRRHVILKARQLGCSTYVEARFLAKCLTVPGTHAAVVAHEAKATKVLLDRVKFFLANLPNSDEVAPRQYENRYELTFPRTHSSFRLGTAGGLGFSRGETLTDFHGSEVAFWPNADVLMAAVSGALIPEAEVWLESTANGMGGLWHRLCESARHREPEAPLFHFFPWTQALEYQAAPPKDLIWSPEENMLRERHHLSDRQLAWRRKKLAEYPTPDLFYQEFPLTPEEAFIVAGSSYFDKVSLRQYGLRVKPPLAAGAIEVVGDEARFFRAEGPWQVWDWYRPGTRYLMVVDASEGLDDRDADPTDLVIVDRDRFSEVLSANGRFDPARTIDLIFAAGRLYRWPLVVVEDNGPGLAVLMGLRERGYPHLFRRRDIDLEKREATERFGWHTDLRTRPLALSSLRHALKQGTYDTRDAAFLAECSTFCRQVSRSGDDRGFRANHGCHDDRVLTRAIACYLHQTLPMGEVVDEPTYRSSYRERGASTTPIIHAYKTGY